MKSSNFIANFSVGFVLFVATIVLVVGLFWVGSGQGIFSSRVRYEVLFPSVSGLIPGSRVYLSGVPAGVVENIRFTNNIKVNKVLVTLSIDEKVSERIRRDSFAWLQTEGLLGDNSVHIAMGTAGQPDLPPGSRIEYKEVSLLEGIAGDEITANTSNFLSIMISILQDIQKGEGTLGQLLKNPELYANLNTFLETIDRLTGELNAMSIEINEMVADIKAEKGLLGKLMFSKDYDESVSSMVKEADELIQGLNSLAEAAQKGEGTLGRLLVDSRLHDRALESIQEVGQLSRRLRETLERAERDQSLVGRWLTDPETGENFAVLLNRLGRSSKSLEEILERLRRGEGTMGMILDDPSIAAAMRNLFLGVQELGYVKSLVRNAEQLGQEISLREARLSEDDFEETRNVRHLIDREEDDLSDDSSGDSSAGEQQEIQAQSPGKERR